MNLLLKFDQVLEIILQEEFEGEFTSAVGIVQDRDRWLLGLAKGTGDSRSGKWCHPGGHIKRGESPKKAAEREVYEEIGIRCRAVGEPFRDPKHKNVAFVHCRVTTSGQKIDINHEFSAAGWFRHKDMKTIKLYYNVRKLIDRVS